MHADAEKGRLQEEINSEEKKIIQKKNNNTAVNSGKHHDRNEAKDTKYS